MKLANITIINYFLLIFNSFWIFLNTTLPFSILKHMSNIIIAIMLPVLAHFHLGAVNTFLGFLSP